MDKFGHEPLHYPDQVQPDKHRRERDPKDTKSKAAHHQGRRVSKSEKSRHQAR